MPTASRKKPAGGTMRSFRMEIKRVVGWMSTYRLALALFFLMTGFSLLAWVSEYAFQTIVSDALDPSAFTSRYGLLILFQNGLAVVLALFLQPFLLRKQGVMRTLTVPPLAAAVVFLLLCLWPEPWVAFIAALTIKSLTYSLFVSALRLSFSPLPKAVRAPLMTFVVANATALSLLGAGMLTGFLSAFFSFSWVLVGGLALALLLLVLVFHLRRLYWLRVRKGLQEETVADVMSALECLAEPAYRDKARALLLRYLELNKPSDELLAKVMVVFGALDDIQLVPYLLQRLSEASLPVQYAIGEALHAYSGLAERLHHYPFLRAQLLSLYQQVFLQSKDPDLKVFLFQSLEEWYDENWVSFLHSALRDRSKKVRYQALVSLRYVSDPGIIPVAQGFLASKSPDMRAAAVIALWQFKHLRFRVLPTLVELMGDQSPSARVAALRVIGTLRLSWEAAYARQLMKAKKALVRQQAALTLAQLGHRDGYRSLISTLVSSRTVTQPFLLQLRELDQKLLDQLMHRIRSQESQYVDRVIKRLQKSGLSFSRQIAVLQGKHTAWIFSGGHLIVEGLGIE